MTISVRPLPEHDLDEADRIFRLAFGTFLGLPEPLSFAGDADLIRPRWHMNPAAVLGAYDGDALVGSNIAANWGSFGFFGPLTVRPDYWDKGVGQRLLAETMHIFEGWGTDLVTLFTFPHSTKHVGLYQKFGFWPQSLTPVMMKQVTPGKPPAAPKLYSALTPQARAAALAECRVLTNEIFPGLDLTTEISALAARKRGDTVLLYADKQLSGFAVCHAGKGSEGGSGTLYIKFGAARPGHDAAQQFERLLDACEATAAAQGLKQIMAGTNTARIEAYRHMLSRGFRAVLQGVAMQRPYMPGTLRGNCFVIDDWR